MRAARRHATATNTVHGGQTCINQGGPSQNVDRVLSVQLLGAHLRRACRCGAAAFIRDYMCMRG